jgi:hypothetical protein
MAAKHGGIAAICGESVESVPAQFREAPGSKFKRTRANHTPGFRKSVPEIRG